MPGYRNAEPQALPQLSLPSWGRGRGSPPLPAPDPAVSRGRLSEDRLRLQGQPCWRAGSPGRAARPGHPDSWLRAPSSLPHRPVVLLMPDGASWGTRPGEEDPSASLYTSSSGQRVRVHGSPAAWLSG